MAIEDPIPLPLAPVGDVLDWWKAAGIKGVIIGGLANAIIGRPRITRDVDALVSIPQDRWKEFLALGKKFRLHPRIPQCLAFARQSRVLLLLHRPSKIEVDVSLGALPFEEEALSRARIVRLENLRIPVATPEDLIIMKAVSHREFDLSDIVGIRDTHSRLDVGRIRTWVSQFAEALDAPEIIADLEAILSRPTKRRGSK